MPAQLECSEANSVWEDYGEELQEIVYSIYVSEILLDQQWEQVMVQALRIYYLRQAQVEDQLQLLLISRPSFFQMMFFVASLSKHNPVSRNISRLESVAPIAASGNAGRVKAVDHMFQRRKTKVVCCIQKGENNH